MVAHPAVEIATLLDFNGVLIDDEHLHFACMAEVLAPRGITLTRDDYFGRYFALDDEGAFRAILRDAGRDDALVASLVEEKTPVYLRRAHEALIFPGAADVVRALSAAGPVAIVSGALRHEIELALARMGVREAVVSIVSAEDTDACKPDPEGYRLGIEALARVAGREIAARAVAVEDSPGGVRAAKAAGLGAVAVLHSVDEAALRAAGADHVVRLVSEIDLPLMKDVARKVHGG